MIVVDTNVWSEPFRRRPEPVVLDWLDEQGEVAVLTSVTAAELRYGVERLPAGKRRDVLDAAVARLVTDLDDLVLPFDASAAAAYAALRAQREAVGQPISVEDGMIAGICRSRDLALATRNAKDFAGLGLSLIDPWQA